MNLLAIFIYLPLERVDMSIKIRQTKRARLVAMSAPFPLRQTTPANLPPTNIRLFVLCTRFEQLELANRHISGFQKLVEKDPNDPCLS